MRPLELAHLNGQQVPWIGSGCFQGKLLRSPGLEARDADLRPDHLEACPVQLEVALWWWWWVISLSSREPPSLSSSPQLPSLSLERPRVFLAFLPQNVSQDFGWEAQNI